MTGRPSLSIQSATRLFFDRAAVRDRISEANRRVLSEYGGRVRKTARRSIRKPTLSDTQKQKRRKELREAKLKGEDPPKRPKGSESSRPFSPPRDVTGKLKRFIFYAYDPDAMSVVIGPVRLNSKGRDIPRLLEEGGRTTITSGPGKGESVTVAPRPYMVPAWEKNLPVLGSLWRNRISA